MKLSLTIAGLLRRSIAFLKVVDCCLAERIAVAREPLG
jgi:hypothetical protein